MGSVAKATSLDDDVALHPLRAVAGDVAEEHVVAGLQVVGPGGVVLAAAHRELRADLVAALVLDDERVIEAALLDQGDGRGCRASRRWS